MFRLSPTFQVFYFNENLARFLSVLGQVSNKVSDDRSRVLQRPCQPVRWSYPSNLALNDDHISHDASPCALAHFVAKIEEFGSPCYHRNTRALTIAGLERFYPLLVFTSLPLAYTVEFFNSRICRDTKCMALNQAAGPKSEVAQ